MEWASETEQTSDPLKENDKSNQAVFGFRPGRDISLGVWHLCGVAQGLARLGAGSLEMRGSL